MTPATLIDHTNRSPWETESFPALSTNNPGQSLEVQTSRDDWYPSVSRRLRELSLYGPNWDSYDSPPPTAKAIQLTTGLLLWARIHSRDMPRPHLVPVSGGGIQLEWQLGSRELELEVLPDGYVEFLAVNDEDEFTGKISSSELLIKVRNLWRWLLHQ